MISTQIKQTNYQADHAAEHILFKPTIFQNFENY
jgi:hypothetical protein